MLKFWSGLDDDATEQKTPYHGLFNKFYSKEKNIF